MATLPAVSNGVSQSTPLHLRKSKLEAVPELGNHIDPNEVHQIVDISEDVKLNSACWVELAIRGLVKGILSVILIAVSIAALAGSFGGSSPLSAAGMWAGSFGITDAIIDLTRAYNQATGKTRSVTMDATAHRVELTKRKEILPVAEAKKADEAIQKLGRLKEERNSEGLNKFDRTLLLNVLMKNPHITTVGELTERATAAQREAETNSGASHTRNRPRVSGDAIFA